MTSGPSRQPTSWCVEEAVTTEGMRDIREPAGDPEAYQTELQRR